MSDVRIIYKSGISDSVWEIYRKYLPHVRIFYTFGADPGYPFYGGWVEVDAPSVKEAHAIFREHYPDRTPGMLNCADYYTEDQFIESGMATTGNRGAFCHRRIRRM